MKTASSFWSANKANSKRVIIIKKVLVWFHLLQQSCIMQSLS